ncbi:hypothetical protein [Streptomyces sp. NPDC093589]
MTIRTDTLTQAINLTAAFYEIISVAAHLPDATALDGVRSRLIPGSGWP